ncbi:PST-A-like protein [Toxoplasma gondii RUB]|uniref:PST-A-like protein n=2 Tax=Toxoplasma gondii TaxID=5811 RepID=B9Q807_TOXGV|nr:PST-A-like protein [Toxoplasma gondii VEG]KFG60897.1 PST-A-like protein [Toxoplasma gondii RUB]CEL76493.1 TPA: Putative lysophospholipase [Toxoplasma gondii VEG]
MGNSQGSGRSRSSDSHSDVSRGKDEWIELDQDEACRFVSLEAPITDAVEFPYDNKPEHGAFLNSQGLRIHTYLWYPQAPHKGQKMGNPCQAQKQDQSGGNQESGLVHSLPRTSCGGLGRSSSSSGACDASLMPHRHSSCSPTRSGTALSSGMTVPASSTPVDFLRGKANVARSGTCDPPYPSSPASRSLLTRQSRLISSGRRALTLDAHGVVCGISPRPEQALLDKAEAVCGCRGVIVLLHGYCNHSRLAWLYKPLPPGHRRRDPTVVGYQAVLESSSSVSATATLNGVFKPMAEEPTADSFTLSGVPTRTESGAKTAEGRESQLKPDRQGQAGNTANAPSTTGEEQTRKCDPADGSSEISGQERASVSWHAQYQGSWVEALNKAGFLVAAMDFQGHGLSEGWQGKRGSVNRLDDFAVDVIQFITIIRRRCQFLRRLYKHCMHQDEEYSNTFVGVKSGEDQRIEFERQTKSEQSRLGKRECQVAPTCSETQESSTVVGHGGVEEEEHPPIFLVGVSLGGWVAARTIQLLGDSRALAPLSSVCDPSEPLPPFPRILMQTAAASTQHSGASSVPPPLLFNNNFTPSISASLVSRKRQSSSSSTTPGASSSVDQPLAALTTGGVAGCVLLSPMLDLTVVKTTTKYHLYRHLIVRLADWTPNVVVSRPHQNAEYPYLEAYSQRDKYTYKGGSRMRMVREMFEGTDAILHPDCLALMSDSTCGALLVMHNLLDGVCGVEGTLRLFHGAKRIRDRSFLAVNAYVDGTSSIQCLTPADLVNGTTAAVVGGGKNDALHALASTLAKCGRPDALQPLHKIREGDRAAGGSIGDRGETQAEEPREPAGVASAECRCVQHTLSECTYEAFGRERTRSRHRPGAENKNSEPGSAVVNKDAGTEIVPNQTPFNAPADRMSDQRESMQRSIKAIGDSTSSAIKCLPCEDDEKRVLPRNLYVECNVEAVLIDKVRAYADPQLHGLDVYHSFPSEPDGGKILARVLQWLLQRARL